ncbi:O-methyltransferase [Acidobacteriota bacterium]
MFHEIPEKILERMKTLEEADARDREDGTPGLKRLRQVPVDTGKLLALLAASAPEGICVEIGTSAGYSTLWIALSCRAVGKKVVTYEVLEEKVRLARETFRETGIEDIVSLVHGDARDFLPDLKDIAFCFLDAEKDLYDDCYKLAIPNMVTGGILVADNVISHREAMQDMIDRAHKDTRVDALIVPIDRGVMICRRI